MSARPRSVAERLVQVPDVEEIESLAVHGADRLRRLDQRRVALGPLRRLGVAACTRGNPLADADAALLLSMRASRQRQNRDRRRSQTPAGQPSLSPSSSGARKRMLFQFMLSYWCARVPAGGCDGFHISVAGITMKQASVTRVQVVAHSDQFDARGFRLPRPCAENHRSTCRRLGAPSAQGRGIRK